MPALVRELWTRGTLGKYIGHVTASRGLFLDLEEPEVLLVDLGDSDEHPVDLGDGAVHPRRQFVAASPISDRRACLSENAQERGPLGLDVLDLSDTGILMGRTPCFGPETGF
jgi:hypothetical protein